MCHRCVWIVKDVIWEMSWYPEISRGKYLDLSANQNPVVWNLFWLAMMTATIASYGARENFRRRRRSRNTCKRTSASMALRLSLQNRRSLLLACLQRFSILSIVFSFSRSVFLFFIQLGSFASCRHAFPEELKRDLTDLSRIPPSEKWHDVWPSVTDCLCSA